MNGVPATYQVHEIEEHLIESTHVAQRFRIKILQPMSRPDHSERFPVLYMTDSDDYFGGIATLAQMMQLLGEAPRFILVGIGYECTRAAPCLRWRDFVTRPIRDRFKFELQQMVDSPLLGGAADLKVVLQSTDAREFLCFIRDELMAWVDCKYPTKPDDRNYFGYSAGGTFGLYTLFTHAETFGRYILGSPGTSHSGDNFGIELAQAHVNSGRKLNAKVFMSVGELEEFKKGQTQFDLVSGFYVLTKFLHQLALPGLELHTQVFPLETHATAWSLAFSRGVRCLFDAVDQVPFLPEFLQNGR